MVADASVMQIASSSLLQHLDGRPLPGVIRSLHEMGRLGRAYCTETRPYNQGSRLTAFELVHDGIPATLVCDSMVAALMARGEVSAVVVGADRIVANGDTANKVGQW
ncbi:unnamed protein product, partial [Ixodes persulcatus]